MLSSSVSSMSFDNLLLLIAGGAPLSYLGWILYTRFIHPLCDVPGPFWASVSRIWIAIHVSRGNAEFAQRDLHRKYGKSIYTRQSVVGTVVQTTGKRS